MDHLASVLGARMIRLLNVEPVLIYNLRVATDVIAIHETGTSEEYLANRVRVVGVNRFRRAHDFEKLSDLDGIGDRHTLIAAME